LRGEEIMTLCGLTEGLMVGVLKDEITEAVLEGKIPNDHDAALQYLLSIKDAFLQNPPVKKKRRSPR